MTTSCRFASVQSVMPARMGRINSSAALEVSGVDLLFLLVNSAMSSSGISARKSTMPGSWEKTSVRACVSSQMRLKSNFAGSSTFASHGVAFSSNCSGVSLRMYSALNHFILP